MNYLCILGCNNNIFKKFIIIGKVGYNCNLGKNIIVRGVVMNLVDYFYGGWIKINKFEVFFWGWVIKYFY